MMVANNGCSEFIAKQIVGDGIATSGIELVDVRHAAAEDDHIRIENVDDHGQCAAEAIKVSVHGRTGQRIALFSQLDHVRGGVVAVAAVGPVVSEQPGAGQKRFHATVLAAVAGRAARVEYVVAPITGDVLRSFVQPALKNNAATDTGAHDHAEHDSVALTRAIDGFGEGKAVGIVGDADLASEQALQILFDWFAVEADGVGIFQETGPGGDRKSVV